MKDLKIRVADEAESKEAQELFFELGYYWAYENLGKKLLLSKKDVYLFAESDGTLGTGTHQDEVFFNNWRGEEITLQELRDMVNQDQDEPFLTPETTLNDQYAEIEQVRQSAIKVESGGDSDHMADTMSYGYMGISAPKKHRHYFKDVSNIAEIDVYAVLKLFEVTDPCLQHIVKKALCAGKRGHKDMMEDLQNIVDTAIRAVELNS